MGSHDSMVQTENAYAPLTSNNNIHHVLANETNVHISSAKQGEQIFANVTYFLSHILKDSNIAFSALLKETICNALMQNQIVSYNHLPNASPVKTDGL